MRYATTWILLLTIALGEVHTFWERRDPVYENWILFRYVPMTVQWNVKIAIDQLNYILYFIAAFYYGRYPNRINKITIKTFIWFMVIDMGMHFYNYKTFDYGYVYFLLALIWLTLYKWETVRRVFHKLKLWSWKSKRRT